LRITVHRLFLIYSRCDHRDLHSFPTRRSSDLKIFLWFILLINSVFLSLLAIAAPTSTEVVLGTNVSSAYAAQYTANIRGGSIEQDRKSTRLNSSHVKSSYAVFCLKKKKNKITK